MMKRKKDGDELRRIVNRLSAEWQETAKSALDFLMIELRSKSVSVALQKMQEQYPELFTLPELRSALLEAAAAGYGIHLSQISIEEAEAWGKAVDRAWTSDKMTLSKKLHGAAKEMRSAIVNTIRQQLKQNATWVQAARALYDGYNAGHVLNKQDIPDYLKVVRRATQGDFKQLRAAKIALDNICRLAHRGAPTKALRSAYGLVLKEALTGSEVALAKAVNVAMQEKSRYIADRIIRTELARAWGDGFMAGCMQDPDVVAIQWRLGSRHPVHDICDMYATADMFNLGPGIYPKDRTPPFPAHPHCLCRLSQVYIGEVDLTQMKNRTDEAGDTWLKGLTDWQRKHVLGIVGEKVWRKTGRWKENLRGYQGFHLYTARLSPIKKPDYGIILKDKALYGKAMANRTVISFTNRIPSLPLYGDPDSITDVFDTKIKALHQRRVYDSNGMALVDYDLTDHGRPEEHPKNGHKHLFNYRKNRPRGKGANLTDKDRVWNTDFSERSDK